MLSRQGHLDQKQLSNEVADIVQHKLLDDEKSENADQQDALTSIRTMLNREQSSYLVPTDNEPLSANNPFSVFVKPNHRKRMIEWCLTMVGTMELRRETIERAINCIDRFILFKGGRILLSDPILYQRAVITALYLMIKLHEEEAIPIEDMAYFCSGGDDDGETSDEELAHTSDQLAAMEIVLLAELQWEINPPTSYEYMAQFLKLLKLSVSNHFDPVQDDDDDDEEDDQRICSDAPDDRQTKYLLELAIFEVEQNLQDYDCWKKGAFYNAFNAFLNALPMLDGGEERAERLNSLLSSAVPELDSYRSTELSTTSHTSSRLGIVEEQDSDASSLAALDGREYSSDDSSSSDDSESRASSGTSSDDDILPEGPLERVVSMSYFLPGSDEAHVIFSSHDTFASCRTRTADRDIKHDLLEDKESPAGVMDHKGL